MTKIVFLLEELSAKEVLLVLLPQIIPVEKIVFQCLPHEGKSDLQKSIPRKIRAWNEPDVHFVVLHDKDSADCVTLKNELCRLVKNDNHPDTLVRIACSELESWFLGDLNAVEKAFAVDLSKKKVTIQPEICKKPPFQSILGPFRAKFSNFCPKFAFFAFCNSFILYGISLWLNSYKKRIKPMTNIQFKSTLETPPRLLLEKLKKL